MQELKLTWQSEPTPEYRHQYVIGDLQGCYRAFRQLLRRIDFDPAQDKLWLTGDLVARGEDSLSCLLLVRELGQQHAAQTVLGNHDLNLLAVWRGFRAPKRKDGLEGVLAYDGLDGLMHWLRRQPLLVQPAARQLVTHAGIPHVWSFEEAAGYAGELQHVLGGNIALVDDFLKNMYGNEPEMWSHQLKDNARLRTIANYFTRMRLIKSNGTLEFDYKGEVPADSGSWPAGFKPWYQYARKDRGEIYFGHWAALGGKTAIAGRHAVDGGCVWGGQLIAQRLEDGHRFSV